MKRLRTGGQSLHDAADRADGSEAADFARRRSAGGVQGERHRTGHRQSPRQSRAPILVVVAEVLLNRLLQPDLFRTDQLQAVVMDNFTASMIRAASCGS